tara:strand:- start:104347 stop:105603 length:1257 start_codon:yes stop_codon:yes gene_type:complete
MFKCLSPVILLAAGCAFDSSTQVSGDGGVGVPDSARIDAADIDAAIVDAAIVDAAPDDAMPDAEVDGAPDATPCVGDLMGFDLLNMDRCDPTGPTTSLVLDQDGFYEFNSDDMMLSEPDSNVVQLMPDIVTQVGGADLVVLTYTDVELASAARLRVVGTRPVVIISTGDMEIAGRLQATRRGVLTGAGANIDVGCATGAGTDGALQIDSLDRMAGSGGGGAGFGTAGGEGARLVNSNDNNSPGGTTAALLTLEPLRGGCKGGSGGGDGGAGGDGGGALHLAVAGTLTISGLVTASGAGGFGVTGTSSGGGGGGSGGAVLIQAGSFIDDGIITVNGGGGGEGSRTSTATDAGTDGLLGSNNAASGGGGDSSGGNGGDGASINDPAEDGDEANFPNGGTARGSGGGGGGLGVIRIETVNP